VIELDHRQPEFTLSFADYIAHVVPESRVEHGRDLLKENQELLAKVTAVYGVPPQFIVALWGIESDFGRIVGDFPVVPALATLAYDGRRSAYFRGELIDALLILEHGYSDLSDLRGSWAGAMGQNQFMPSSYLRYAVDYGAKGKRDIWRDRGDVFASTANYLLHEGWNANETWGREVRVPPGFDPQLADLDVKKSVPEWNALGVRLTDGTLLPEAPSPASIVLPAGAGGPAYLVYGNFRTIMKWNKSVFFATAVGLLADRIEGR
jgi:membrane-bound lytic murein transglycosylase B